MTSDRSGVVPGTYVANVTPFRDDERFSLDLDAYLGHVRWLAGHGVTGIVPFGTNGEGPSVSPAEKRTVLDALLPLVDELPGDLQIIPAVTEGNLPETLDQLAYLDDLDVPAVLVLPPYYFTPTPMEGLRVFYERVLAATRHRVIIYHIPKYAVAVPVELVLDLPVWGVKDSEGGPGYSETVHRAGLGVMVGTEDDLPGRLTHADGSISALANIVPEQVVALYDHVRAGRVAEAEGLSSHLRRVRAMTKEHSSIAVLKRIAAERNGQSMGTVRPPLLGLSAGFDAAAAAASALGEPLTAEAR